MATLNIGGKKIKVDDAFLKMSADEQNAAVEEIAASMGGGAPPQSAPASMPGAGQEYDAMGNATGQAPAAPVQASMPYGEQMANVGKLTDNLMRSAANGMTFGLADKFAGGMDAVTGQAPSYDAGVKAQRATSAAVPEGQKIAGEIAGGLVGGMGLAKNGITLATRVGPSLLSRVLGFGAEGAIYGGAHGAGNTYSENASDYIDNAKTGAKWGTIIGGGLPAAGSLVSGGYKAAAAFLGPRVEGLGRGASAMLRTAAQADEAGLRALPSMGPEAMLVDAGPAMTGLGQGAGTGTGQGRTMMVDALRSRDAATGGRLAATLDNNLGPAPIPSRVEAGYRADRAAISPEYEAAFANAKAVDTPRVIAEIDALIPNVRGEARSQLQRVRDDLHITDAQGNTMVPDPHPRALFAVRNSIDGVSKTTKDSNVRRVLGDVRKLVDDELTAGVPGIKAADAKWSASKKQSEGLERGGQVFDGGKGALRPQELADELAGATPEVRDSLRKGARAEVDRLVGTNVNDLNKLETTLGTPQDWNSQKFAQVFGDGPHARVVEALMNNRRFRQSYQDIVQGSQSAQRLASAKAMDGTPGGNVDAGTTLTGLGLKAVNMVAKAISGAANANTKDEIGRILSSQGPEVQRIARELLLSAQKTGQNAGAINRVLSSRNWIGASTAPAADRK